MQSINPDIVHARKFNVIAKEIQHQIKLDWSSLHATSPSSILEMRNNIINVVGYITAEEAAKNYPRFIDYMIKECECDVYKVDWEAIALAVDNQNGMYHPLRLTKIVLKDV